MDLFLQEDWLTADQIPWTSSEAAHSAYAGAVFPVINQSAFLPYRSPIDAFAGDSSGIIRMNANKRMIAMLRSICRSGADQGETIDKRQCYRHMIIERQRRKKMKQSYKDLHALLPPGTKGNMNAIVETAGVHLRDLQGLKNELQQRNTALQNKIAGHGKNAGTCNIKFRVENPSDAIKSMIQVLKCLKAMELKAVTINSGFSGPDFAAVIEIESKIGTREAEAAVKNTLMETDTKCRVSFPGC